MTGWADLYRRDELLDAGAVDVFVKPVDFRALALRMRDLIKTTAAHAAQETRT